MTEKWGDCLENEHNQKWTIVKYKKRKPFNKNRPCLENQKKCDFCKHISHQECIGVVSNNSLDPSLGQRQRWEKWDNSLRTKVPLWFCSMYCLYQEKKKPNGFF